MAWRLACDLGTNSFGWCALHLAASGQPDSILDLGVRIFGDGRDPKSKNSLAVDRRAARAMRRRRDRFKQRQKALIRYLTADGLFPEDGESAKRLEALDPYLLRFRALDQVLSLHEIGRALFHLNQRRGFRSNRKTDGRDDKETGKISIGIDRLRQAMSEAGARTYGEFLYRRRSSASDDNHIPSVRARLRPETGHEGKGDGYDFYPGRSLIEEEFEAIWDAQAGYYPDRLTAEVRKRLFEIVFGQRPLKAPIIGKCTLIPGEPRLPKAHPLFQRRRLLEEVNSLMLIFPGEAARPLTREQRDLVVLKLKDRRSATFDSLRKLLKLPPEARFNKESEERGDIKGDEVSAEMGAKSRFGGRWAHFPIDRQWEIVERLLEEEDIGILSGWLRENFDFSAEQLSPVLSARLPQGYGRFGETATRRLIASLEAEVIPFSEAVKKAGLGHHSDFRTGEVHLDRRGIPSLPYYGIALERHIMPGTAEPSDPEEMRVGRLGNPTVHIGLNQVRKVVNRLIGIYGPPKEIALELARELKLSDEEKDTLRRRNRDNRVDALRRSEALAQLNLPDTGANRARLRLWEELNKENVLDRRCIYSGRQISAAMVFSDAVEVDHILPFSRTLDDSQGNKILCLRESNRGKRNQTPFEAWGGTDAWEGISVRASRLPREKRWRFQPDAMDRFEREEGFVSRQLTDTQYLSRLAREYLSTLSPEKGEGSSHVWVSPGRLTEIVRRKLGLNSLLPDHNYGGGARQPKNRLDHRHHAIDAAVIGIIDRSMLQLMAQASAQEGGCGPERVIIPEPWAGFTKDLGRALEAVVVSHRPDHGSAGKGPQQTAGRLHNDTAYGLTGTLDARGNQIVVHRVPLTSLKPDGIGKIRDAGLRDALATFVRGRGEKDFEKALRDFSRLGALPFRGIRRVRICEPLAVITICDRNGRPYKGYKGDSNYRFDVWQLPDGKWVPEVVSMYDAHQPGRVSDVRKSCPTALKVLSLRQDDVIAIEPEEGGRQLMRVVKFGQNGQITLAAPNEGGDLKRRDADPDDPFKYSSPTAGGLKRLRARQVRIDESGRVFDPGFPARRSIRCASGRGADR